ncbi:uncharacterized protein LOC141902347 [Tubulanus polymorphus]|uniref:uncharacterized protein LOC141902347 n=1 Tax=Tubulanus polymorphus TaxID=672921 RepID=UPI003DA3DDD8
MAAQTRRIQEELLVYLCDNYTDDNPHLTLTSLKEHLKSILKDSEVSDRPLQAERWLYWAQQNKYIKCIETEVPVGILPDGCNASLIDAKVFSKKRGPDDEIYDNNDDIRNRVARGNCLLRMGNEVTCIIYALKKFTGGLGDDDDKTTGGDDFTWKRYFIKELNEVELVCATKKANGEAAHLSCIDVQGEKIICAGSKNVHLLFKNRSDIEKYVDQRFRIAKEVAQTVSDFLDQMDKEARQKLLEFLCVTHFTAVFEILSPAHQHVENLSHLERPMLKFIAWTKTSNLDTNDLCCVVPHIGFEIGRILKLDTVEYDLIPVSDLDLRMQQVRCGYNSEGEVFYFLDFNSNVVGLLKKKTVWYIMCRAIREKSKAAVLSKSKKQDFKEKKALGKTKCRILEIRTWLKLDDDTTSIWQGLAINYIRWCLRNFESSKVSQEEIIDKFPDLWKRFLAENDETDEIIAKFINS